MSETVTQPVVSEVTDTETTVATASADESLVLEDVLVEDVSIDGMCGVY